VIYKAGLNSFTSYYQFSSDTIRQLYESINTTSYLISLIDA
jgi:hypothetical protein